MRNLPQAPAGLRGLLSSVFCLASACPPCCPACPSICPPLSATLPTLARPPTQFEEGCTGELRAAFGDELSDIGRLATDFFASCDEVLPPLLPPSSAGGPAPAPAQA
jgi:hypothetical protein